MLWAKLKTNFASKTKQSLDKTNLQGCFSRTSPFDLQNDFSSFFNRNVNVPIKNAVKFEGYAYRKHNAQWVRKLLTFLDNDKKDCHFQTIKDLTSYSKSCMRRKSLPSLTINHLVIKLCFHWKGERSGVCQVPEGEFSKLLEYHIYICRVYRVQWLI